MGRATQGLAITEDHTALLEERSRSDPGIDTLNMELLSPSAIMPPPLVSSMGGVMTNQSDFRPYVIKYRMNCLMFRNMRNAFAMI